MIQVDANSWREAKALLAEALTRPPDQRDAFLVERCADPAVRREVESFLHEYDTNFLESALTASTVPDGTQEAREPIDLPPGTHVGPYVVLEQLGIGGMGQVFLANDTRLHRKVALKCLIASASEHELRTKLLQEARAAARINHSHIATVHDVFEHDGRAFLVMEYVEGESLADLLRRERLPLDRILAIGRQLASALTAAHARGIVHRDLKPANVQIGRDGSVKVLDFGIAQAVSLLTTAGSPTTTSALKTDTGVVHPGTPAYMSPEQMFGRPVDHRSDIYSLGVILYEMVTGHRPYAAADPLDLVMTLGRRLLRPDGIDPTVPRELSDVVAKALALSPDDRFQTAAELEAELAALQRRYEPISGALANQPARWTVRRVARAAAIVVSVPMAVLFLGFIETAAFNHTLGRTAPFDRESPSVWFEVGVRSLVWPIVECIAIVLAVWGLKFGLRVLSLSHTVDTLLTTSRTRGRRLTTRLGLDDPAILAQAASALGLVVLVGVAWRYWDVINAWTTFTISSEPSDRLLPLQPGHRDDLERYRVVLNLLLFVFAWAAVRVAQLRARQPFHQSVGSLVLVSLPLLATAAMGQVPYRIMMQSKFERVVYAGARCYLIGDAANESLIYCPGSRPPRNRVIAHGDPALEHVGVVENIFIGPDASQ